jgi:imidazolonepropionase-like amidohydrolase
VINTNQVLAEEPAPQAPAVDSLQARELSQRATDSALRYGSKETGATYLALAGLREVEAGNRKFASAVYIDLQEAFIEVDKPKETE